MGRPWNRWVLPAVWLLTAGYLWLFVRIGWIPHDEGVIGQSAERVLLGELPHRDFVDVYTGGLSFLHAVAFRLIGVDLVTPRLVLYAFALAWLPCVYWIARRFVAPVAAAAVAFAAVAWSLPHYFVALPSWYNLFFATACAAALMRFAEVPNRMLLGIAGVAAGLSVLAKATGFFAVAGGMLAVAFLNGGGVSPGQATVGTRQAAPRLAVLGLPIVAFLAVLLLTLRNQFGADTLLHFFVPAAAVAWMILRTAREAAPGSPIPAWIGGLIAGEALFLAGVALPLVVFAVPFALNGATADLLRGVFVLPTQRFVAATWPPPPLEIALASVLVVLAISFGVSRARPFLAGLAGLAIFVALRVVPLSHLILVAAAQSLIPVTVVAGAILVLRRCSDSAAPRTVMRQAAILFIMLALCSLVQFPYAYRIYFLYVAPLLVLGIAAVYRLWVSPPRAPFIGAVIFAIAVGTVWMNHRLPFAHGYHYTPSTGEAVLPLERAGGIRTSSYHARLYGRLVDVLREHASGGVLIAAPDAPEVYFLTGLRNPTPHLFEFFGGGDVEAEVLATIDSFGISAVAINRSPDFTPQFSAQLMRELEARFGSGEAVGHYLVLWR